MSSLYQRLCNIYEKTGQYGVYAYAKQHPTRFNKTWVLCEPCEDLTPTIRNDDSCSVCGTKRKDQYD